MRCERTAPVFAMPFVNSLRAAVTASITWVKTAAIQYHGTTDDMEGCAMTQLQKDAILRMRRDGLGYTEIAKRLDMSVNTVKSFGRRCEAPADGERCRQCEQPITQTPGRKPRRFCSDACRLKWWHQNPTMMKTALMKVCPGCGIEFIAVPRQKHCGHSCYITARFGGARHEHAN